MLRASRSEVPGRGARIAVAGDGERGARGAQRRQRRLALGGQAVVGHRQQHRHGAGARERLRLGLAGIFQVIAGERAEAGGQERAAEVGELLRMHLHRYPERARRTEEPLGLRDGEGDALAEDVHGIDQALRRAAPAATPGDGVDVVIGAAAILRRQRVRGQERGAHRHREGAPERARDAQHLRLILEREPVAGLDLERRHALAGERRQARRALLEQLCLTRGAHRAHAREDAAAGARDLLVGAAAQPLGVLGRARAGEHQVRVAVDQSGGHPGAAEVVHLGRLAPGGAAHAPRPPR